MVALEPAVGDSHLSNVPVLARAEIQLDTVSLVLDLSIQGLTIEVKNLEHSRRFYEDVLGFEPGAFYEPTRWQPYNFGAQFFGIREMPEGQRRSRLDILNFVVADVESLWERVKEGADVVDPLAKTPWGSYKFVITDPDGFHLGFVQRE